MSLESQLIDRMELVQLLEQRTRECDELVEALCWASENLPSEVTKEYEKGANCVCPACRVLDKIRSGK